MPQIFLFDLDGTLTDPKEGITKSFAYALNSFGIPTPSLDEYAKYIGPPLRESFAEQVPKEQVEAAVAKYRE
ncbi:MAG: HAD hydrolase-like protein, partial [Lachnospiraceae bacterium]|nr:HAD hydrolase-like protein [Lachnospiraceae bacterium]